LLNSSSIPTAIANYREFIVRGYLSVKMLV